MIHLIQHMLSLLVLPFSPYLTEVVGVIVAKSIMIRVFFSSSRWIRLMYLPLGEISTAAYWMGSKNLRSASFSIASAPLVVAKMERTSASKIAFSCIGKSLVESFYFYSCASLIDQKYSIKHAKLGNNGIANR